VHTLLNLTFLSCFYELDTHRPAYQRRVEKPTLSLTVLWLYGFRVASPRPVIIMVIQTHASINNNVWLVIVWWHIKSRLSVKRYLFSAERDSVCVRASVVWQPKEVLQNQLHPLTLTANTMLTLSLPHATLPHTVHCLSGVLRSSLHCEYVYAA